MLDTKYIRMTSFNYLEIRNKVFNDRNKLRVNNKRSFINNSYLFLVTRFVYNYTHYQTISVTNFS